MADERGKAGGGKWATPADPGVQVAPNWALLRSDAALPLNRTHAVWHDSELGAQPSPARPRAAVQGSGLQGRVVRWPARRGGESTYALRQLRRRVLVGRRRGRGVAVARAAQGALPARVPEPAGLGAARAPALCVPPLGSPVGLPGWAVGLPALPALAVSSQA